METRGQQKLSVMQTRGCTSTRLKSVLQSGTAVKTAHAIKQSPKGSGRAKLRRTMSVTKVASRTNSPAARADGRLNKTLPEADLNQIGRGSSKHSSPSVGSVRKSRSLQSGNMVTRSNSVSRISMGRCVDKKSTLSNSLRPDCCSTETDARQTGSSARNSKQKSCMIKDSVNEISLDICERVSVNVEKSTSLASESAVTVSPVTGEIEELVVTTSSAVGQAEKCASSEQVSDQYAESIQQEEDTTCDKIGSQRKPPDLHAEILPPVSDCRSVLPSPGQDLENNFQFQSDLPARLTPVVCLHKLGKQSIEELSAGRSVSRSESMTSEPVSSEQTAASDGSNHLDLSSTMNVNGSCSDTQEHSETKKPDQVSHFSLMSLESLIAKVSDRVKCSPGNLEDCLTVADDVIDDEDDDDDEENDDDEEQEEDVDAGDDDIPDDEVALEEVDESCREEDLLRSRSESENIVSVCTDVSCRVTEEAENRQGHTLLTDSIVCEDEQSSSNISGDSGPGVESTTESRTSSITVSSDMPSVDKANGDKIEKAPRNYLREYKKILTASLQQQTGSEEVITLDDDDDDADDDKILGHKCSDSAVSGTSCVARPVDVDRSENTGERNTGSCEQKDTDKQAKAAISSETDKATHNDDVTKNELRRDEGINCDSVSPDDRADEASDEAPEDKVRQLLRSRKDTSSRIDIGNVQLLTAEEGLRIFKDFKKGNASVESKAAVESDKLDVCLDEVNKPVINTETLMTAGKEYEVVDIDGTLFRAFDSKDRLEEYIACIECSQVNEDFIHSTKQNFVGQLSSLRQKQFRYGIAGNVGKYLRKRDEVRSGMKRVGQYLQRNEMHSASLKPNSSQMNGCLENTISSPLKSPTKTDDVTKIKGWRSKYSQQDALEAVDCPSVSGSDVGILHEADEDATDKQLQQSEVGDSEKLSTSGDALLRILHTQNVQDLGLHLRTQRGGIRSRYQVNFHRHQVGEMIGKPSTQILKKKNIASIEEDENQPSKGWIYGRRIDGKFATKAAVNKIKKKGRSPVRRYASQHVWDKKRGRYYTKSAPALGYIIISKKMALNAASALSPEYIKSDPCAGSDTMSETKDSKDKTASSQLNNSHPPSLDDYIAPQEDNTVDKYPPLPEVKGELPPCGHSYCRLGQVCSSISGTNIQRAAKQKHCGRPECVLNCVCDKCNTQDTNTTTFGCFWQKEELGDEKPSPTNHDDQVSNDKQINGSDNKNPADVATDVNNGHGRTDANVSISGTNPKETDSAKPEQVVNSEMRSNSDGHKKVARKPKVTEPVRKCSRLQGHKSLAILERANPLIYYDTSWWSMIQNPKSLSKKEKKKLKNTLQQSSGHSFNENIKGRSNKRNEVSAVSDENTVQGMQDESCLSSARTRIYPAARLWKSKHDQQKQDTNEGKSVNETVIGEMPSSGYINTGSSDLPIITSVHSLSDVTPNDTRHDHSNTVSVPCIHSDDDEGCQITHVQLPRRSSATPKHATPTEDHRPPGVVPQKKIRVQMVMLQKKSKGREKSLALLEIKSDCDWSSVRTALLSKISSVLSKMSECEPMKDIKIEDFVVSYCKHQTTTPVPIPRHMQKPLVNPTVKEMVPVRFFVTKKKESCMERPEQGSNVDREQKSPMPVKDATAEHSKQMTEQLALEKGQQIEQSEQPVHRSTLGNIPHPCSGGLSSFNHFKMSTGTTAKSKITGLLSSRMTINSRSGEIDGEIDSVSSKSAPTKVRNTEIRTARSPTVLGVHGNKRKGTPDAVYCGESVPSERKRRRANMSVEEFAEGLEMEKDNCSDNDLKQTGTASGSVVGSNQADVNRTGGRNHLGDVPTAEMMAEESNVLLQGNKSFYNTVTDKTNASNGCTENLDSCVSESEKAASDMPILIPEDDIAHCDDKDLCSAVLDSPPVLEPQLDSIDASMTSSTSSQKQKTSPPSASSCFQKGLTTNIASPSCDKNALLLGRMPDVRNSEDSLPDIVAEQSVNKQATSLSHHPQVTQVKRAHSERGSSLLVQNKSGQNAVPILVPLTKQSLRLAMSKTNRGLNDAMTTTSSKTSQQRKKSKAGKKVAARSPQTASNQRPMDQPPKGFSSSLQSLLLLPVSELCSVMKPASTAASPDKPRVAVISERAIKRSLSKSVPNLNSVIDSGEKRAKECHVQEGEYIDFSKPITIEPLLSEDEHKAIMTGDQGTSTVELELAGNTSSKDATTDMDTSESQMSGCGQTPTTCDVTPSKLLSLSSGQTVLEIKPDDSYDDSILRPQDLTDLMHEQLKPVNTDDLVKQPSPPNTDDGKSNSVVEDDIQTIEVIEDIDIIGLDEVDHVTLASNKLRVNTNQSGAKSGVEHHGKKRKQHHEDRVGYEENYDDIVFEEVINPTAPKHDKNASPFGEISTYKCHRERKRRHDMAHKFSILQDMLYPNSEKMAKQFILDAAIKTLANLQAEQDTLIKMRLQLSKKREGLISRIRSLKGKCKVNVSLNEDAGAADHVLMEKDFPEKLPHKRKLDCSSYAPSYAELAEGQSKYYQTLFSPQSIEKQASKPKSASELLFPKLNKGNSSTSPNPGKQRVVKKKRVKVAKGGMAKQAARSLLAQALTKAKSQASSAGDKEFDATHPPVTVLHFGVKDKEQASQSKSASPKNQMSKSTLEECATPAGQPSDSTSVESGAALSQHVDGTSVKSATPVSQPLDSKSMESTTPRSSSSEIRSLKSGAEKSQSVDSTLLESATPSSQPLDSKSVETTPPSSQPLDSTSVETAPPRNQPLDSTSVETAPPRSQTLDSTSVETAPPRNQPLDSTSVETAPPRSQTLDSTSVETTSLRSQPLDSTSVETTSLRSQPLDSTSVETTPPRSQPLDSTSPECVTMKRHPLGDLSLESGTPSNISPGRKSVDSCVPDSQPAGEKPLKCATSRNDSLSAESTPSKISKCQSPGRMPVESLIPGTKTSGNASVETVTSGKLALGSPFEDTSLESVTTHNRETLQSRCVESVTPGFQPSVSLPVEREIPNSEQPEIVCLQSDNLDGQPSHEVVLESGILDMEDDTGGEYEIAWSPPSQNVSVRSDTDRNESSLSSSLESENVSTQSSDCASVKSGIKNPESAIVSSQSGKSLSPKSHSSCKPLPSPPNVITKPSRKSSVKHRHTLTGKKSSSVIKASIPVLGTISSDQPIAKTVVICASRGLENASKDVATLLPQQAVPKFEPQQVPKMAKVIHFKSILTPVKPLPHQGKHVETKPLDNKASASAVNKLLATNELVLTKCERCQEGVAFSKKMSFDVVCPSCNHVIYKHATKTKPGSLPHRGPSTVLTPADVHPVLHSPNNVALDVIVGATSRDNSQ